MPKALVIDDVPEARMFLVDVLEELGWEVSEAENCRMGLDALKETGKFDLALVDWRTPEMTGLEFVRAVRSETQFDSLPMIMVTGLNEMDDVAEALGAGVNEYLMKPFTQEMLFSKMTLIGLDVPE